MTDYAVSGLEVLSSSREWYEIASIMQFVDLLFLTAAGDFERSVFQWPGRHEFGAWVG